MLQMQPVYLINITKINKRILYFFLKEHILDPFGPIMEYLLREFELNFYFIPELSTYVEDCKKKNLESKSEKKSFTSKILSYIKSKIPFFPHEKEEKSHSYEFFSQNNDLFEPYLQNIEEYNRKREIGENDSYICELIRNDSVEEFIQYINQRNIPVSSTVPRSIYETCSIAKVATLIEYAAFYGSIQIFQYLRLSNAEMNPRIWIYAIHGRNPEIFHIIEENKIDPFTEKNESASFVYCYKEAIKCYHNEIANYIKDNLLSQSEIEKIENTYQENIMFDYDNFENLPDLSDHLLFCYFVQFNYNYIIKFLIDNRKIDFDINLPIVNKDYLFFIRFIQASPCKLRFFTKQTQIF